MGHSIQQVRGRHAILNDTDLFVLMTLAQGLRDRHPSLAGLLDDWLSQFDTAGVGCIDLSLDNWPLLPIAELLDDLRALLDKRQTLPMAMLNVPPLSTRVTFTRDFDVKHVKEAVRQLRDLVAFDGQP